jgi:hypothetical protein
LRLTLAAFSTTNFSIVGLSFIKTHNSKYFAKKTDFPFNRRRRRRRFPLSIIQYKAKGRGCCFRQFTVFRHYRKKKQDQKVMATQWNPQWWSNPSKAGELKKKGEEKGKSLKQKEGRLEHCTKRKKKRVERKE